MDLSTQFTFRIISVRFGAFENSVLQFCYSTFDFKSTNIYSVGVIAHIHNAIMLLGNAECRTSWIIVEIWSFNWILVKLPIIKSTVAQFKNAVQISVLQMEAKKNFSRSSILPHWTMFLHSKIKIEETTKRRLEKTCNYSIKVNENISKRRARWENWQCNLFCFAHVW